LFHPNEVTLTARTLKFGRRPSSEVDVSGCPGS
jgi:hypothetical protein